MQNYLFLLHVQWFFPQGRQLYLFNEMPLLALPCINSRQQVQGMVTRAKKVEGGNGEIGKPLGKGRNIHKVE